MKTSTGKPTKAQQARFDALREIGCICCWNFAGVRVEPEIHHLTAGFKRLGHDFTIPLSPYHHRGVIPLNATKEQMLERFGPSLALNKREFVRVFGTERQLLETVNAMIERRGA